MKKTLFIIGLSAIFMAGCQNGEMQERERQLQDSFASVMSAKNAEMEAFFQQLNEIETSWSLAYWELIYFNNLINIFYSFDLLIRKWNSS